MGGIGSGRRWHFGARSTTDSFRSIDVRRWQREKLLTPGSYFGWNWLTEDEVTGSIRVRVEHSRLRLIYKTKSPGEEWQDKDYPVILDSTECNFGGSRKWFICPARGCGRRVALLYGGAVFVCRHCNQLAYPSQNEDASDRATRQAERIRRKLGWTPGILNGSEGRPKRMHRRTYERLCAEHDEWANLSIAYVIQRFGITGLP